MTRHNGEHREQVTFFDWVRLNRRSALNPLIKDAFELCYAVANGANLPKKKYQKLNSKTLQMEWKTWSSEAKWLKDEGALEEGLPDINLDWPVSREFVYCGSIINEQTPGLRIEMKYGKNSLEPEQKKKKALLEKAGFKVVVCYTATAAIRAIVDYLPYDEDQYQGIKEFLR